jgi:hypothetical protein
MKLGTKYWSRGLMVAGVLIALLGSTMVFADTINPGVLAIDAKLGGQTYGQWSENWWQWAYSVTTFDDCPNQSGRMWFLAGAPKLTTGAQTPAGSQPTETTVRNCTVPAGKSVMFPLFNAEQSVAEAEAGATTGNLPGSTCPLHDVNNNLITGKDYNSLLSCAQAFTQHVLTQPGASLGATVDGQELTNLTHYRAESPPPLFPFTAVKGNPFGLCELLGPCPLHTKAAADGFWIILGPDRLPVGQHTIHFTAVVPFPESNLNFTYTNDVTYNLTVK